MKNTTTSNFSRRALLGSGVGLAAIAALTACGRSAVKEGSSGGNSGVKAVILTQSSDIQPASFMSQNNPNFSVMRTVFNTLTAYDRKTLEPQPQLAKSWTFSADKKTLTMKLRDDVTFHNGEKFTSADVAAAIAFLQLDTTSSQVKHNAKIISAVDSSVPDTVVFTLEHGISNLFDMFEMMSIPGKDSIADLVAGKAFIGTGPFKVDSYKPGQGIMMSKNEKYFLGAPKIDTFEIQIVAESSSRVSSLKTGGSQISMDLAPLDAVSFKGDSKVENIIVDTYDSAFYVASNVTIAPLDNKEVRKAIAYSVDRAAILTKALSGIGQISSLPWSKGSPAFDQSKADTYKQDLAKAKSMVEAAGATGQEVKIHFIATQAGFAAVAQIVQEGVNATGLKATLVPLQPADFQKGLSGEGLPGMFVSGHGFGQLNPATLLKGAFPFNANKNASRFESDEYKALATAVWESTDPARSKELYGKVNDFLLDQQFVSNLVSSAHTYTISTKLKGLDYTELAYLNLDKADLS